MGTPFVKVGDFVFNVTHIIVTDRYVDIYIADPTKNAPFQISANTPEGQALIQWATDPSRCTDLSTL